METPQNNEEQHAFISLASKVLKGEDLKRIQPYLKRLKTAIDTKGITNIALAGAYGSGKSTILDTFLDENKNYKTINISLASFKDNDVSDDKLERTLEISILQQLFYHVKPSTIPDSRFKRIIHIPDKKLGWFSLGLINMDTLHTPPL